MLEYRPDDARYSWEGKGHARPPFFIVSSNDQIPRRFRSDCRRYVLRASIFCWMLFPALLLNTLHQLLYHQGFMPCPLRQFVPLTDPPQSLFPKLPSYHRQLGSFLSQTRIRVSLFYKSESRRSILSTKLNMVWRAISKKERDHVPQPIKSN